MRRRLARWLLAALYAGVGIVHLAAPDLLLPIVPAWVPWPREVVLVTGVCEIAGALGLMIPRWRALAGIMLALYAACVYPANVKHALDGIGIGGLPSGWWYHGPRLALQPVFVWVALWAAEVIDWPFGRKVSSSSRIGQASHADNDPPRLRAEEPEAGL